MINVFESDWLCDNYEQPYWTYTLNFMGVFLDGGGDNSYMRYVLVATAYDYGFLVYRRDGNGGRP